MKVGIYTIRDEKAGIYQMPFYAHNDNTALRTMSDLRSDNNSPIGRHPEDFRLYRLGTYDDNNAQLDLEQQPEYLQETTT